jgi:nudix-type nucleoside diphosphatase (YffH/AdpP family)
MTTPNHHQPLVTILEETDDYAFESRFRVRRATLQHRRFDGTLSEPITRISFERGDSVGVLLFDPGEDTVVLVRQFRYPVFTTLAPEERDGEGARQAWTLELVAGIVDSGRTVRTAAHRELLEELGYLVGGLEPIATIYPSPGASSERIHLFLSEVDGGSRAGKGGGVRSEGEDIQTVVVPLDEAMEMVGRGEIQDAKTIVALQHLVLRRLEEVVERDS